MSKTTVITSFTKAGYELYGMEFIKTFRRHWPYNTRLVVYFEGDDELRMANGWEDYWEVPHMREFFAMLPFEIQHGRFPDGHYDINYDAGMARKAFMQANAVEMYGGKVFWIDADSITHAKVPDTFLDEVLPDDKFCCYLGRHTADGKAWYYTESGFLGFNAEHQLAHKFFAAYKAYFLFGLFMLHPRWHDCEGFDQMRIASKQPDAFVNLAAHLPYGTMHPFVNSVVGKYMDHRKGPRKTSRSGGVDLVVERSEPYWQAEVLQTR